MWTVAVRDSRQMCFFHNAPKSTKGRRLANNLHRTFDRKYDKHQPNRGFRGTVSERNLYVLRNTTPVAVFLELGNIRNKRDQQRLVLKNNPSGIGKLDCGGNSERL